MTVDILRWRRRQHLVFAALGFITGWTASHWLQYQYLLVRARLTLAIADLPALWDDDADHI